MLTTASLLLIYAGFALLQSAARGQPLAAHLSRRAPAARVSARLLALAAMVLACLLLVPERGWTEACLVTMVEVIFVASLFVLLAPLVPRFAWRLALAAPPLAAGLTMGARWTS